MSSCARCPHHVRHGRYDQALGSIEFSNHCGLKMKQLQEVDVGKPKIRGRGRPSPEPQRQRPVPSGDTNCINFPFPDGFDHFHCSVYQATFESKGLKNGVVPTKDFQYSERLSGVSVTDMELL